MKKLVKWGGISLAIIFVLTLIFGGKGGNSGPTAKNAFEEGLQAGQKSSEAPNFEVITREDKGVVENISVLVQPGTPGIETIGSEIKKSCKKQCNISIYDERKAYDLQEEYDKMMGSLSTDKSELDAWNDKHYIYVADHLVGYINFETDTLNEYPYKDAFYDEMKAKK